MAAARLGRRPQSARRHRLKNSASRAQHDAEAVWELRGPGADQSPSDSGPTFIEHERSFRMR